jgi:hypothetical protein
MANEQPSETPDRGADALERVREHLTRAYASAAKLLDQTPSGARRYILLNAIRELKYAMQEVPFSAHADALAHADRPRDEARETQCNFVSRWGGRSCYEAGIPKAKSCVQCDPMYREV